MHGRPKIFFWIATSVADVVAANPNGTKTLLANSLSKFAVKGKPVFSNSTGSRPNSVFKFLY